MTDLPESERPRERLLRLGSGALGDAELVAILLGAGRPGTNVLALAVDLLIQFGGVSGLLRVQAEDLTQVSGVGLAMATRFVSAAELCRRSASTSTSSAPMRSSKDLATAAAPQLADLPHERLLMFPLTSDRRLRSAVVLADGEQAHAHCAVALVLKAVLAGGCTKFALVHNHPSGNTEPSVADLAYTEQVSAAARQCGLQLIDHLIVAGTEWRSII